MKNTRRGRRYVFSQCSRTRYSTLPSPASRILAVLALFGTSIESISAAETGTRKDESPVGLDHGARYSSASASNTFRRDSVRDSLATSDKLFAPRRSQKEGTEVCGRGHAGEREEVCRIGKEDNRRATKVIVSNATSAVMRIGSHNTAPIAQGRFVKSTCKVG